MSHGTSTARHALIAILGVWLGALVTVGVAAAIAFPTMKKLNPTLADFGAVGDHWSIAAGSVFQPMFIGMLIFATGAGILASVIAVMGIRGLTGLRRKLLITLVLLATLSAAGTLFVARGMRANWLTFIEAAKAGDTTAAATARAAFDKDHPLSSSLLKGQAVVLLLATISAVLPMRSRGNLR